jgi:hypothetical protein
MYYISQQELVTKLNSRPLAGVLQQFIPHSLCPTEQNKETRQETGVKSPISTWFYLMSLFNSN